MAILERRRLTQTSDTVASPARRETSRSFSHAEGMAAKILGMQQTLGNQAVQQMASTCPVFPSACPTGGACHTCPARIQAKLAISQPGNVYEQEAERVAEQVIRMLDPRASKGALVSGQARGDRLQRLCSECEEEDEKTLQMKAVPGQTPEVTPDLESGLIVVRGGGQPLPESVRAFFEPRFGYDFRGVRVHTDARAAESARAVNALAYTIGRDIAFSTGQYAPATSSGQKLLGHELTHVVQQSLVAGPDSIRVGRADPRHAHETRRHESRSLLNSNRYSVPRISTERATLRVQRLGANPDCIAAEARDIHQAIFDARGWLNKAIPKLEASPLSPQVLSSLRRNFGPTYGVAANASLIRDRLRVGRAALGRIPFSCDTAGVTPLCIAGHCGWSVPGSNAATICTNPPSTLSFGLRFRAGCVLHEALHAAMAFMTVDHYTGSPGYPGPGTDPLLNPEGYTELTADLS